MVAVGDDRSRLCHADDTDPRVLAGHGRIGFAGCGRRHVVIVIALVMPLGWRRLFVERAGCVGRRRVHCCVGLGAAIDSAQRGKRRGRCRQHEGHEDRQTPHVSPYTTRQRLGATGNRTPGDSFPSGSIARLTSRISSMPCDP